MALGTVRNQDNKCLQDAPGQSAVHPVVFLDNSSTVSLSDVHFFRKRVVLIVGCVASLCVGFSLVLVPTRCT